jgi:chromate transporter
VNDEARPTLRELTAASFKVGCLGFGGPAGQIALMHRVFVEERKWIAEERYLHALNYCMLLPGPEAQQLATYVGWLLHGVKGGVIAGLLFVIPGALIVFGLSWLYAEHGQAPAINALFYGVKAAVLGFIVDALVRIGRRSLKAVADLAVAAAAFLALYLFGLPFPVVILAAAAFGAAISHATPETTPAPEQSGPSARKALISALAWGAAWLAPVALAVVVLGPRHMLSEIGLLFSQLAVVTFGGAYAVLAYLQQQAVDVHAWLTPAQMIDGLGLAETTPGPLILVNQFVGFLAGWQAEGGLLAFAAAGAFMASWCTFAPSFVWIFAGAPYAEALRRNRYAAGGLRSVSAAVLGVIAALSLWFGQHVLFSELGALATPWGRSLLAPVPGSFDPVAALIALAATIALIRFRTNAVVVVLACAAVGWLRYAVS